MGGERKNPDEMIGIITHEDTTACEFSATER